MSIASIIIPARYASSRYPGKPLAPILGRHAILWTIDAARKAANGGIVAVATDDERIAEVVEQYGCKSVLTSESCRNGTERVAEAAISLGLGDDAIVVNLQGDSLLTPPEFINAVIRDIDGTKFDMVTPALQMSRKTYDAFREDRLAERVGGTTVVFSRSKRALFFSKEVIPFLNRDTRSEQSPAYHHVGLYAYRVSALKKYADLPIGPLEQVEQLEQLRFIENDLRVGISVVTSEQTEFWELNNPEDVGRIEAILRSIR